MLDLLKRSSASTEKSQNRGPRLEDTASAVLQQILRKYEDVTVIISSREGKCLTSTLDKPQAQDHASCMLTFTDKVKVLTRKVLNEELKHVRIRGQNNEIVITFDDNLEIITIQQDKGEIGDLEARGLIGSDSSEES